MKKVKSTVIPVSGGGGGQSRRLNPLNLINTQNISIMANMRGAIMKFKKGFTLAEVLITLGIIGIVAALTMPSLIQKQKEKETVTRLKKTYSVLQQAYTMAVSEYGTPDNWDLAITHPSGDIYDYSGTEKIADIFGKYLKVVDRCKKGEVCNLRVQNLYNLNGTIYSRSEPDGVAVNSAVFKTNDGAGIGIGWVPDKSCKDKIGHGNNMPPVCADIAVYFQDSKNTAKIGESYFYFYLSPQGIIPYGLDGDTISFENNCNVKGGADPNGRACTAWVIYNENMDYLRCDDLSWKDKTKCN